MLLEGRVVHVPDTQADPELTIVWPSGVWPSRTQLAIPLLREGTPVGVLVLARSIVQPFTVKQIGLATTFADQAVIAIENVRLFDEVQARSRELGEALEQQTATSEVLGVISSSPGELEPVFQAMLANATRLCDASYGALWLCEGEAFRCVALHGGLPEPFTALQQGGVFHPGPESGLARVAKTRQTVQIGDIRTGQGYLDRDPLAVAAVELANIRTLIAAPMLKGAKLVGGRIVVRRGPASKYKGCPFACATNSISGVASRSKTAGKV